MSCSLIGGVEGGATHSHVVLMNSAGDVVATASGPGSNHHLLGMEGCWKRIVELVNNAKKSAGISIDTPLLALGLSLSGCEQEETNQQLVIGLQKAYPNLSEKYAIGSDTEGSVAATSNKGGVTCIAGTGSNTLLINPDGTRVQCGGWGYHLGDEGSAWNISRRAVKYCFDDLDNFEQAPYPIDEVWNLVKSHFSIEKQADILTYFYGANFEKANIASLCKKLSLLARAGDPLSQYIFKQAGNDLAKSIRAVICKAAPELTEREGGIHILCVGSVWLSWDLLEEGFVTYLRKNSDIEKMSLLRLKTEMGVGAALMASDRLEIEMYRDYSKNYNVFYRYNKCGAFNGN